MFKAFRDMDIFRVFLKSLLRLIDLDWGNILIFRIMKRIVTSCIHHDTMPVVESLRQMLLEQARVVLLSDIISSSQDGIVDRTEVVEFVYFMYRILDPDTNHLSFREMIRGHVIRRCGNCRNRVERDISGGKCARCTVMNYCSRECQRDHYWMHRGVCVRWEESDFV